MTTPITALITVPFFPCLPLRKFFLMYSEICSFVALAEYNLRLTAESLRQYGFSSAKNRSTSIYT